MAKKAKAAIRNFYDHADTRHLTQLQELSTELYLAGGKAAADKLWAKAAASLEKLGVPESASAPILSGKDPAKLATLVQSLLKGTAR